MALKQVSEQPPLSYLCYEFARPKDHLCLAQVYLKTTLKSVYMGQSLLCWTHRIVVMRTAHRPGALVCQNMAKSSYGQVLAGL